MTDNVTSTDNVLQFPQIKAGVDIPTTQEELESNLDRIKTMFFEMVSVELSAPVFNRAAIHGFDVGDDECMKDCILIVESIKSLLMKSKGVHHYLQDYAQENIKYDEDDMIYDDEV